MFPQGRPVDLVAEFAKSDEGGLPASVRNIIYQIFTYMAVTGVEFAWLSCWYSTWLVRRPMERCDSLQISSPFQHSDEGHGEDISTMAALSWFQAMALDRTLRQGIRHACLPTDTAPGAEAGSGGLSCNSIDNPGDDKDDEDYDPDREDPKVPPKRWLLGTKGGGEG